MVDINLKCDVVAGRSVKDVGVINYKATKMVGWVRVSVKILPLVLQ